MDHGGMPQTVGIAELLFGAAGALGIREVAVRLVDAWAARARSSAEARGVDAEAEVKLGAEWRALVDRLEARVAALEGELHQLQAEYVRVMAENAKMEAQLEHGRERQAALEMKVAELEAQLVGLS